MLNLCDFDAVTNQQGKPTASRKVFMQEAKFCEGPMVCPFRAWIPFLPTPRAMPVG